MCPKGLYISREENFVGVIICIGYAVYLQNNETNMCNLKSLHLLQLVLIYYIGYNNLPI